jgi:hypothetical protein
LNAVIRELLQPEIELPVMTHLLLQQELDWFPLWIFVDLAAAPIVPYIIMSQFCDVATTTFAIIHMRNKPKFRNGSESFESRKFEESCIWVTLDFFFGSSPKAAKICAPPPKQTADLNTEICYTYCTSSYAKSASNPLRLGVTLLTKKNGRQTYTKWTTQRD